MRTRLAVIVTAAAVAWAVPAAAQAPATDTATHATPAHELRLSTELGPVTVRSRPGSPRQGPPERWLVEADQLVILTRMVDPSDPGGPSRPSIVLKMTRREAERAARDLAGLTAISFEPSAPGVLRAHGWMGALELQRRPHEADMAPMPTGPARHDPIVDGPIEVGGVSRT